MQVVVYVYTKGVGVCILLMIYYTKKIANPETELMKNNDVPALKVHDMLLQMLKRKLKR